MFGFNARQRRQPAVAHQAAYIAVKSELDGTLRTEGDLQVDGIIHGNVEVRGHMEISEEGLVEGLEIRATNLTIRGVVKAKIFVDERLTLTSTGRLEGDIIAASINIEPGAFYVGYISTSDSKALPASSEGIPQFQPVMSDTISQENISSLY